MSIHPTVARYAVDNGQLHIGGVAVERLAERVGHTPFFAYDRGQITDRVQLLRATLPERVRLSYAVKANPMPAVVQHLRSLVDHMDVASAGEMMVALDSGLPGDSISFAGPGKRTSELSRAIAAGVTIEIESAGEASRVVAAGGALGMTPRVAVRVNPDFEVRGSGMRMGGGPQQFGVDAEEVGSLLDGLRGSGLEVVGFHVFAGSQNLFADRIASAQSQTVELVLRLADKLDAPLRYLNLGGGFGIPYHAKDTPLDLAAVGQNLQTLVHGPLTQLPDAMLVVELGRYLVGEAGVYVTRVVDRKVSRGRTYLVVDGGLHHQLAASGNFGSVIRRNYPVVLANRMAREPSLGRHLETVSVVGCLCTPLDLLADDIEVPAAQVGDLVAVFQAGAYGLTASPTAFLGHPHPLETLV